MDFKTIGLRVKSKRKQHNLTQEKLAEELNISVEYLSRIESGKVQASFTLLGKLAEVFDITEEELMFGVTNSRRDSMSRVFNSLPPEKQEAVLNIANIIAEL